MQNRKKNLSCVWCNTKGIHNSNDFCKSKVAEREKSGKPEEGKADQVKGRDKSPAGHGKQQDEDVKQVKAVYPDSDITSDDDEQAVFAKQCKAEECEGHVCSSLESMIPTPTVQIKLKNGLARIQGLVATFFQKKKLGKCTSSGKEVK